MPNVVFDSARPIAAASADGRAPCYALLALEDIAKGEELCISYTSTAEGPGRRAEHLQEHYGFKCACVRCKAAEDGDVCAELDYADALEARRCTRESCGSGLCVPIAVGHAERRCVHCGEVSLMEEDEDEA